MLIIHILRGLLAQGKAILDQTPPSRRPLALCYNVTYVKCTFRCIWELIRQTKALRVGYGRFEGNHFFRSLHHDGS